MDKIKYAYCNDCKDSGEVDVLPNGKVRIIGFGRKHHSHRLIIIGDGLPEHCLTGVGAVVQGKVREYRTFSGRHNQ